MRGEVGTRVELLASFLGRRPSCSAGEPSGFARVSAPLMAAAMRRANRKELRRLTRILEQD
ncbi:MAG: hypothetical protein AB7V58_08900 [Solirubrobacterales bacterium]